MRPRGVATPVIILVLIVMFVLVFSYFTSVRQRRFQQFKQVHGELAYALARMATDLARTHLEAAVRSPDAKLFKALTKPASELTPDSTGRVVLESIDVLSGYRSLVDDVLKAQESPVDMVSWLTVSFFLKPSEFGPFEEVKAGSLSLQSPREKQGRLFIEASCVVSSGLLNDTEQKLTGVLEFRATVPGVPVLSDFTMFLAESPRGGDLAKLNTVEANTKGIPQNGKQVLVLQNGDTKPRVDWAGKLDAAALAKQGWVFIGGDAPTVLKLAFGSREDDLSGADADASIGEDFQFFQEDPAKPRNQRAYADREANQLIGNDAFWEIRYWDIGMPDSFGGGYLPNIGPAFSTMDHMSLHANLLHLYGRPGNVSPTLVFGRVEAAFLRVAAAAPRASAGAEARGAFCVLQELPPDGGPEGFFYELEVMLPQGATTLPPAALEGDTGQVKSGKFMYLNPQDRTLLPVGSPRVTADVYRKIQSSLRQRNYNTALQYLQTKGNESNPSERGINLGLPARMFVTEAAGSSTSGGPYTVPEAAWPREVASRGELDLRQLIPVMGDDKLTVGRASRRLKAGSALESLTKYGYLKGTTLALGGIVELTGALSLPAGITVARGGMIIADDITVEGDVTAPDPDQPLVLVARRGGVRIEKQSKVQAALVAPVGTVSLAGAGEVTGQVVAKTLDLDRVEAGTKFSQLGYDGGLKGGAESAAGARRFQIDVSKTYLQVK